jgi:hypothetical protein
MIVSGVLLKLTIYSLRTLVGLRAALPDIALLLLVVKVISMGWYLLLST